MSKGKDPSHVTRMSWDASSYDEICVNCNSTDVVPGGWGDLANPCPNPVGKGGMTHEEWLVKDEERAKHAQVSLAQLKRSFEA